jgi:hypothetical protein
MAAEIGRTRWMQFRSYSDKLRQKMFDQMYDFVKLNNAACSNACRPVVVHAVLMSIIFEHNKQLRKLMEQQKVNSAAKSSNIDVWTLTEGKHDGKTNPIF